MLSELMRSLSSDVIVGLGQAGVAIVLCMAVCRCR